MSVWPKLPRPLYQDRKALTCLHPSFDQQCQCLFHSPLLPNYQLRFNNFYNKGKMNGLLLKLGMVSQAWPAMQTMLRYIDKLNLVELARIFIDLIIPQLIVAKGSVQTEKDGR